MEYDVEYVVEALPASVQLEMLRTEGRGGGSARRLIANNIFAFL